MDPNILGDSEICISVPLKQLTRQYIFHIHIVNIGTLEILIHIQIL